MSNRIAAAILGGKVKDGDVRSDKRAADPASEVKDGDVRSDKRAADPASEMFEMLAKAFKSTRMTRADVEIERAGSQIVLPEGMGLAEAVIHLQRKAEEEMKVVRINERISAFPLDGAVALARVLKRRFSWTTLEPTPGFFGDTPPMLVGVSTSVGRVEQVPWGRMTFPGIEGWMASSFTVVAGQPLFSLVGEVQRRFETTIKEIADAVRKEVIDASIYRGSAVRMNLRKPNGERIEWTLGEHHPIFNDPGSQPQFLDLRAVDSADVIFPLGTQRQIDVNVFNPVLYSDRCRKHGIPLKRCTLLEGPYGVGKTLIAYTLAQACERNGWTFLYVSDVRDLDLALAFGRLYQPCVVFAEDVDKAADGARDPKMDRLLNTLDGIDSKDSEVMVILTTNSVEVIHPAFLRPGRIDAVVSVRPPDAEAAARLVRRYGRELINDDATDEALADAMRPVAGQNAAFVREAVERAKLAAIAHAEDNGEPLRISADDLAIAARSMRDQVDLHSESKDGGEQLVSIPKFIQAVSESVQEACSDADGDDEDDE